MLWLANILIGTRAALARRYRRRQERQAMIRELSALDDRILNDIGMPRHSLPLAAKRRWF